MATLADLLRTGYTPPTESPMVDPIKQHFASLPQKFEENQRNQMDLLAKAYPGNTFKSMMLEGDPKAMSELAMQAPIVGMTKAILPRKDLIAQQIEKIAPEEYRGSHVAPNYKTYGAPFYALDEMIPKDVYSQQGKRLYGIGDATIDHEWYLPALKAKGKPDALVEVYRSVPKGVKDINSGDWVTTSKKYAQNHGESALNGEYEIISKKVKANTLSSEGYPYELGYHE
jgi:hypothetical protein